MSLMMPTILKIAEHAGKILLDHYGKVTVSHKFETHSVLSMVTEADRASEKYIVESLRKEFPDHGIVAEEGSNVKSKSEFVWYIDPLDGTSNYARNIPLFGISLGLTRNGQPFFGMLSFPALNFFVWAQKGKGAFAGKKAIHVSSRTLKDSLFFGSGNIKDVDASHFKIAAAIASHALMMKVTGSSSYNLAQIAMGNAELYIVHSSAVDMTAGHVILHEAGGTMTDDQGNPWALETKRMVASNGKIHQEVLELLRKANIP